MKKEVKILFVVMAIVIIIYIIIRINKGYFTLGYIPLLGYQARTQQSNNESIKTINI